MAKIARPVQEISEFSEQSLYHCALIEKIKFSFIAIFSHIKCGEENHQSRKLKQFPDNRSILYSNHTVRNENTCILFQ